MRPRSVSTYIMPTSNYTKSPSAAREHGGSASAYLMGARTKFQSNRGALILSPYFVLSVSVKSS